MMVGDIKGVIVTEMKTWVCRPPKRFQQLPVLTFIARTKQAAAGQATLRWFQMGVRGITEFMVDIEEEIRGITADDLIDRWDVFKQRIASMPLDQLYPLVEAVTELVISQPSPSRIKNLADLGQRLYVDPVVIDASMTNRTAANVHGAYPVWIWNRMASVGDINMVVAFHRVYAKFFLRVLAQTSVGQSIPILAKTTP